ncbi:phosphotransferase [Microbacterium paraoxydans]|uniref:phosphotransferase n=1 Tax=Microbacterium paraoxydans TaxID=199592 RepID=UPI00301322B1
MARLDWTRLPPALRARIEEFAGSPVTRVQSQDGGFSAGLASRLTFADGRRLFVKAVQESAEGTFALYVREAEVLGAIPRSLPAAHRADAFTAEGWAVLFIEDVEGRHPERSATSPDTVHVLDAIAALAAAPAPSTLPRLADELHEDSGSWRRLEAAGLLETTTPWCAQNVDLLRTAAERVGTAVAGDRLLHGDLRADNILIDTSGRARLLDWPWAARGAGWEDALLYLLDLRVEDPAAEVGPLLGHPVFAGSATEDRIALLSAAAGAWFEKCRLPAPPGMTTLRDFQRREAITATDWIAELVR